MALKFTHNEIEFGIGDRVRVHLAVADGDKTRDQVFEGMVIKLKGRSDGKTFTVRRIGEANIGIEKIFPLALPTITKVEVVKRGIEGSRRAKLYYTRTKSPTEVESIYKKAAARIAAGLKAKIAPKTKVSKKVAKKTSK